MRKTLLLPGLCLLFCTSVRGTQYWSDYQDDRTLPDEYYPYLDNYDYYALNDLHPMKLRGPEEEKILKMAVLETLVEDVADALRAIASETVAATSENVSDPKRRIKFGRIGKHKLKPIRFPSSGHKPPKIPLPELGFGIDTEIVIPTSPESSEQEE